MLARLLAACRIKRRSQAPVRSYECSLCMKNPRNRPAADSCGVVASQQRHEITAPIFDAQERIFRGDGKPDLRKNLLLAESETGHPRAGPGHGTNVRGARGSREA